MLSDPILEESPSLGQQAEQKVLSGLYRGPIDRVRLAKSGYSVRRVDLSDVSEVVTDVRPKAGDLVLARVKRLGQHQHLEFVNGRRSRLWPGDEDRKSTRLNSSHLVISYAVFCLKKKKTDITVETVARLIYSH